MKKAVTTREYAAYRDKTAGCLSVMAINYDLCDSVSGDSLIAGRATVTEEARLYVKGKHPSGNSYSSTVYAMLDIITPTLRNFVIQRSMCEREINNVGVPETSAKIDEQGRRLKAITWSVTDIDDEINEVWVKGVV